MYLRYTEGLTPGSEHIPSARIIRLITSIVELKTIGYMLYGVFYSCIRLIIKIINPDAPIAKHNRIIVKPHDGPIEQNGKTPLL